MTDEQPDMTATEVVVRKIIYPLEKRVTNNADHIATELGKLETQAKATSDVLEALSTHFIESHDELSGRVVEQGHGSELIHNKITLLENRFAGVEKNLAQITINHSKLHEDLIKGLTEAANLPPPEPDHTELYKSLIAAQLEIKNATVNVDNEFTKKKYADLASVMDAVREPLANHGLAIVQLTADVNEEILGIKTMLIHESGQSIEDIITMRPAKYDPQGIGSCRTYMRRYAVLAICAIAGAVDDDGQGASGDPNDYERITSQEAEAILVKADDLFAERADAALAKMLDRLFNGATRVGDIKAGEAHVAITNLENAAATMAKTAAAKAKAAKKLAAGEKAAKAEADEK